jgi:SAM-dependent methyltransferase
MCNSACIEFAHDNLHDDDVRGKRVLEVGSLDHNGSVRQTIVEKQPAEYLGVDLEDGPGVDKICDVTGLVEHFGSGSYDVVAATELVEHVEDWRAAFSNLKRVLAPGGILLLTTRSFGYPYHGAPDDHWRYEVSDMRTVLADMSIESLESDPLMAGVFVTARKPSDFLETDLEGVALYSMIAGRRVRRVSWIEKARFRLATDEALRPRRLALAIVPHRLRAWVRGRRPSRSAK